MGKVNVVTKEYMRNNDVFSDAFNYFIYGGKQVIQPENLHEIDPGEILTLFDQGNQKAVEKLRDLLKITTMMSDDKAAYLILGIENESQIRYVEPVKSGLYDFLRYAAQVISVCTNTKIEIDDEEEAVDVCKAVDQMTERARREGRLETLRNDIKNVMEFFHVSLEEAMAGLKVTKEEQALLKEMV